MQYFSLFDLPEQYALDESVLTERFRAKQTQHHPDKFANASDAERRRAEQTSALINDAYKTLRDPVARAAYLLKERWQIDAFSETNTQMPKDFLIAQMELREQIADFCAAGNTAALERTADNLALESKRLQVELLQSIDQLPNADVAVAALRKLRFLAKVSADIDNELAML